MNEKHKGHSTPSIADLVEGMGRERSLQMMRTIETGARLTALTNAELVLLMEEHVVFDNAGDSPIKELLLIEVCRRLDPTWLPKA